ncbi:MAG: hypothetical protein ACOYOJ_21360 [Alsobacter sp.]
MPSGFDEADETQTHAFIQWKGTDVCMDFHCHCGTSCHVDASFAYTVRCPTCQTVWEMPMYVYPRKATDKTMEYWRDNPINMTADE